MTAKPEATGTVRIGLMGDVMLGRLVNETVGREDHAYPWGDLLPLLAEGTDLNVANLETTLTTCREATPKVFNFRAEPDRVRCLEEASVDAVNLANNHVLDFGDEGLLGTLEVLDEAGIARVGAGRNREEARRPALLRTGSLRVGLLGCTDNEEGWAADEGPGTFWLRVGSTGPLEEPLVEIRRRADLVVLSIHWGPNMRERPPRRFRAFARELAEAGVDVLHGHSAHVFQGVEVHEGSLILYDTGDFVDDYAVDGQLRNDRSFLFLVDADADGPRTLTLVPTLIDRMQVNRAPEEDARAALDRMRELSAELGTDMAPDGTVVIR